MLFLVPPPPALGSHNILSSLSSLVLTNSTTALSNVENKNYSKTAFSCNNPEECDLLDEEDDENFFLEDGE
jgi:hypothetical protein